MVRPPVELRLDVEALYAEYARLIDDGPLSQWGELFAEDAVYKVLTRENVERGWPLALILCENRAAIEDRITAVDQLMMTVPRAVRHLMSGFRIEPAGEGAWAVRANFAVFETIAAQMTKVYAAGLYDDVVVRAPDDRLRFARKISICDGDVIPNSLVLPL